MITAKEARAQATSAENMAHAQDLKECETKIKSAAAKGETNCVIYKMNNPRGLMNHLSVLGYQVTHHTALDQRDSDSLKISW